MREQEINLQLGRRIRHRRRSLQITQAELGKRCGISFQQVQKYECAANAPSAARLIMMAEALDVPLTYFADGLSDDR